MSELNVNAAESIEARAANPPGSRRRRGRPPLMSPATLIERIRQLAARGDGLYRIHRRHGALYARARRLFGSWSGAVLAAGVDYENVLGTARRRALETRRRRRQRPR